MPYAALVAVATLAVPFNVSTAPADFPAGRIAFARVTSTPGGLPARDIFVMKPNGHDQTRLTRTAVADETDPAWSPGGQQIAFTRFRRPPGPYGWTARDVFVMNADGTGVRRLTRGGISGQPAWSPDGKHIAFTSWANGGDIVVVAAANGSDRRVIPGRGDSWSPSWSPDGTRLAFCSNRDATKDPDFASDIYVMSIDGSGVRRLTYDGDMVGASDPAWSPDGRRIAYTTARQLETMSPIGPGRRIVVRNLDGPQSPSWSPDGQQIVFEGSPDSPSPSSLKPRVLVVDATGRRMRVLALNSAAPTWSSGAR